MTMISSLLSPLALCAALLLPVAATMTPMPLHAQSSSTLAGTVLDPRGVPLPGVAVSIKNEASAMTQKLTSDGQGKYSFANVPAGKYTIQVDAPGFNTSRTTGVAVAAGQPIEVPVTLEMGNASEQITVEANDSGSVAAALAPMDALLDEHSARTEITQAFIANFTSPLADYGEAVEMAPGTFTTNGNGTGLGQSKTYFRGFPDGDYDIDYDGIPFYDTNTPTHHSWAFFPTQWVGGIDFDRSPGTASTIGPTPFGGSIHLLSRDVSPVQGIRGGVSYGSWGTLLVDGQYDSGNFLGNHKASLDIDVQHMDSKGYQTNNFQNRNAGSIKAQYKFSDKTVLSGFSGVEWLDANTPNFNATRCQMYGAPSDGSYTCTGTNALYAGAGIQFLNAGGTDMANPFNYRYNRYHVPTDFEYVGFKTVLPFNINLEFKPYTYNYDNSELYTSITPITDATTINGSKTYLGLTIAPCNVPVVKKGVTAIPCGVDKYNSYRKYGETFNINQTSKLGILRAGVWYEWAATNRHQYPSDPSTNWIDQALPNFAEKFWTNSYQPFVEYEFHPFKKFTVTPGVKFAYYTVSTKQYADDGKTIGCLCATGTTGNPANFITNGGNYYSTLPSIDANYRIRSNWSAYAQLSTGSIVPPSATFDFNQTLNIAPGTTAPAIPVAQLPKQQHNTTWQGGTVFKLKRVTLDMDAFHIRFQGGYSNETNPTTGEPTFFPQPSSISKGLEGQSNIYVGHGLSAYLNATIERAYYTGFATIYPSSGSTAYQFPLNVATPSGLWVQQTPSDTEAEGVSYLHGGWDVGLFNKRVGTFYLDDSGYHNQTAISPFDTTNTYLNYTLRSGSRFDQTKIRLSVNNLLDLHSVTGITQATSATGLSFASGGQTYTDPFNATSPTAPINGADNVSIFSGRSIVLSVTVGLSPKR